MSPEQGQYFSPLSPGRVLLAVGCIHLQRKHRWKGRKERPSRGRVSGPTGAAAFWATGSRTEGLGQYCPEGQLLCRGKAAPRRIAAALDQPDAQGWDELAGQLAAAGINTLFLDMRGFGESGSPYSTLPDAERGTGTQHVAGRRRHSMAILGFTARRQARGHRRGRSWVVRRPPFRRSSASTRC